MDPKMEAQTRSFFSHLAPFFCARRLWGPKWLPRPPPRAPKTSPSLDFHWFWIDFWTILLMIFCIMWATFYLVCLITLLVTSSFHFQISGHKFECVGVDTQSENYRTQFRSSRSLHIFRWQPQLENKGKRICAEPWIRIAKASSRLKQVLGRWQT